MLEIPQLSNVTQFVFFVGCGFLSLQFPFGWTAALFAFLLAKTINPSSVYVAGLSLNSPSCWVVFLLLSSLLLGLSAVIIGKLPIGLSAVITGKLPKSPLVSCILLAIPLLSVLLFLAGTVFSTYTVFRLSSAFSLDIVIKIMAFLIGAVLGSIISLHFFAGTVALASGESALLLIALAVSNILSIIVMLGTYLLFTFPKIISWTVGIILGALILVLVFVIIFHMALFENQIKLL